MVADFVPTLFELRSYRAVRGRREELIGMFEEVFLDAYQAGGARIVATFRDLADPERWVWMRAFADAPSRGAALRSFYDGETWHRHADACNATIEDIDEALLLRQTGASVNPAPCAPPRGSALPRAAYVLDVHPLGADTEAAFAAREFPGAWATFVSDHSENSYPRQPVRAQSAGVVLMRFASPGEARRVAAPPGGVTRRLLQPTARSGLR